MNPTILPLVINLNAKKRGLTVDEYLKKYNPLTDSLLEFNENTPAQMETVVVSAKKRKAGPEKFVAVGVAVLVLIILLTVFKSSK